MGAHLSLISATGFKHVNMPRQVAGVAVDVMSLRDVAKLILGTPGSAVDVLLRRKEHRCAAEASKLIQLSLVRGSTVSGESAWGR